VTVSEDPDLETVADVIGDDTARAILTATSVEPMSATELSDHCEVDVSTAYRWTDRLREAGLLAERTRPREDGHHDEVYVATLAELSVRLEDGDLEVEMTTDDSGDRVDRLTSMWEDL
jgi:DNA-binding transcriptional ArsR family regulator